MDGSGLAPPTLCAEESSMREALLPSLRSAVLALIIDAVFATFASITAYHRMACPNVTSAVLFGIITWSAAFLISWTTSSYLLRHRRP